MSPIRRWFAPPYAYVILFIFTLVIRVATALPLAQPGYMDASYAMHVAENLAQGRGFTEQVLWNYLDQPEGIPHPSNLYWMPLPAVLIAPVFALLGDSYRAAQAPFVLLSSFLPLFAFYLSKRVLGRNDYAWASALFTLFSGFYMVYWVSPDNFTPFALTAALALFFIALGIERDSTRDYVLAGILIGLSHLARADGLLLLVVAPLALVLRRQTRTVPALAHSIVWVGLGYLIFMAPWFVRNYLAIGTPYPSAGTKTIWLTAYDELFRLTDDLTPARYFAWGLGPILGSKLYAAGIDLLVVSFGTLQLFLLPPALVGLAQLRRRVEFTPFFLYAILLYLAMVLVFTFPSVRGSMLHSSAAFLPYLAVAAPPGIDRIVSAVAKRRRAWVLAPAQLTFRWGLVTIAVIFSLFIYGQGIFGTVIGSSGDVLLWNQRDAEYAQMTQWLDQNAGRDDIVMDVDPPAFYNVSHRQTIAIPTDNVPAVFQAAAKYKARYLLLRFDHPKPLNDLYRGSATVEGLNLVARMKDAAGRPAFIYEVAP